MNMQLSPNGKELAFQASYMGSIPISCIAVLGYAVNHVLAKHENWMQAPEAAFRPKSIYSWVH